MTKISELTVAELSGAAAQIEAHMKEAGGFDVARVDFKTEQGQFACSVWYGDDFKKSKYGDHPEQKLIHSTAEHGDDWSEFSAKVWSRIGKLGSRERRELEHAAKTLGAAIEDSDKYVTPFAAALRDGLVASREDVTGRLITYQGAE